MARPHPFFMPFPPVLQPQPTVSERGNGGGTSATHLKAGITATEPGANKFKVPFHIDESLCTIELDLGSVFSIIMDRTLPCSNHYFKKDFQWKVIPIKGLGTFKDQLWNQTKALDLFGFMGSYSSLLDMEWFEHLGIAV